MNLPDRADHPFYTELIEHIRNSPVEVAALDFRHWCQTDFWFWCRFCMSSGEMLCRDPHNRHFMRPWLDHPWLFERCRDLQENPNGRFFKWARNSFKSTLITTNLTLWDYIQDLPRTANLRTLILTYKLDVAGEAMLSGIKKECEQNKKLHFHWPEVFWADPQKDSQLWTKQALLFRRTDDNSSREPSIRVAGLDNQPTSYHCDLIVMDDAVTREAVTSEDQIRKVFENMRTATFLGEPGVTKRRYIGTNWAIDDPWTRAERDGFFLTDNHPCFDANGEPVLQSMEALREWERMSGPYAFSCQMMGNPISSNQRIFLMDWFQDYGNDPEYEAKGKNVYIFADLALGGAESDFSVLAAIGLGADGHKYLLDLRRDRWSIHEFDDNLLEMARKWRPIRAYIEQFAMMTDVERIREKMRERRWRGLIVEPLPRETADGSPGSLSSTTKGYKSLMIQRLQDDMSRLTWWFPRAVGYRGKKEPRDTIQVLLEEEYRHWSPGTKIAHDDMLNTLAMVLNKNVPLMWPQDLSAAKDEVFRAKQARRRTSSGDRRLSAWVA